MAKAVARCTCEMCGAVYTVLNPAQKYCEACAPIAIREPYESVIESVRRRCVKMDDKKPRKTNDSLLAQMRREKGLTQSELAAQIGCYAKDVSRWETGARTPGAESLAKLAAALGCTSDDIILGILTANN